MIVIPKIRIETTNPQDGPDHITREVSQWYDPLVQMSASIDSLTTGLAATNKQLATTQAAIPVIPPTQPFQTTPGGGGGGGGGGSQSFITADTEPTLAGSRKLIAGTNIALTDGGPLSTETVAVTAPPTAWTPALAFGGSSVGITYGTQTGSYVKIGNLVIASFSIILTSKGAQTGTATLSGLPATSLTGFTPSSPVVWAAMTNAHTYGVQVNSNATTLTFLRLDAATAEVVSDDTDFSNTSNLNGTVCYIAA